MPLNIACFDIESTSLNASFGRLLCACFKFQGEEEVRIYEAFKLRDEEKCLRDIRKMWDSVDILATWYGKRFDVRFLDAKATRYGIAPFFGKMHIDMKFTHAHRCATAGHSLAAVSEDLRTKNRKYDVPREMWQAAADGDKKAFREIVLHCQQDVLVLEEVLDRTKQLLVHITR